MNLPQPTDSTGGRYTCSVETLDGHGLLHTYLGYAHLTSLGEKTTPPSPPSSQRQTDRQTDRDGDRQTETETER